MLKFFPPKFTLVLAKKLSIISRTIYSSSSSSTTLPHFNLTDAILNCKTPHQALVLFNSASNRINPTKNLQPHSAIIHVLTKAKLYTEARCLMKDLIQNLQKTRKPRRVCHSVYDALNHLETSKFSPNVFGVLIIALSEMGLVDEALWVYKKIGVLPPMQACNALLNGFLKMGRFDFMWEIYGEMAASGMCSSAVTYDILIDGCCKHGDLSKACKLFDELIDKGIGLTVVIYTILIRGLCSESKMLEAESMFRTMRELNVLPNVYTYNTMMDGHCKVASVCDALELYWKMLGDGLHPNIVTFGICKCTKNVTNMMIRGTLNSQ